MDVELYVYDLSQGLARQMSAAFLGTHIDAVYHTSLVFGGREYFFGAGIQTSRPGATHHGRPMEVLPMGRTELDMDTVGEYLEALRAVYTPESYDLFQHNCNNFTNDLAAFLVGHGIPAHITSLPATVLQTPFGQMLRPQLDRAMRGITQASSLPAAQPNGVLTPPAAAAASPPAPAIPQSGIVHDAPTLAALTPHLSAPRLLFFFTSATCPPCRTIAPAVASLAAELPRVTFVRIDLARADAALRARFPTIRATPTFRTVSAGDTVEEWSGADAAKLEANVRLLAHMGPDAGSKGRERRDLPTFGRPRDGRPILFAKVPPLDKLRAKLADRIGRAPLRALWDFVSAREAAQAKGQPVASVALPGDCADAIAGVAEKLRRVDADAEAPALFPLVDLVRLVVLDPRVGALALAPPAAPSPSAPQAPADEKGATSARGASLPDALLNCVNGLLAREACPYALHLTALQAVANLFAAPIASTTHLVAVLAPAEGLSALIVRSLLQEDTPASPRTEAVTAPRSYAPVRAAAAALAHNALAADHALRLGGQEGGGEAWRAELAAALVEALRCIAEDEESNAKGSIESAVDARAPRRALLLALGLAAFGRVEDGEVAGVLEAVGARDVVTGLANSGGDAPGREEEALRHELLQLLE